MSYRDGRSTCKRCFHTIGEHLLCRDHGGEEIWSAGAYRQRQCIIDVPPPEALNDFMHPWWAFLDEITKINTRKVLGKDALLGDIVP